MVDRRDKLLAEHEELRKVTAQLQEQLAKVQARGIYLEGAINTLNEVIANRAIEGVQTAWRDIATAVSEQDSVVE